MDGGTWWAAVHGVAKSWTRLSNFTFMHWRRKWQPTPVFLPGESQRREAGWTAVYGVAQSRTRLKRCSSSSSRIIEKAREFQKNIYFCFIDYAKAFDCVGHNKLWKILKEMGIPDHLTCLLRNLYAGQEATVRTGHGTTNWFQIGKEYVKAVYCHPVYLTSMQSTS